MNRITMLREELERPNGEKVEGVTTVIDGKLQEVLDIFIAKKPEYNNYIDAMSDILLRGVESIMRELDPGLDARKKG